MVSARAFSVTGLVQGVGYRPFVCRVARELGLVGWVENVGDGVVVLAAPGPTLGDEAARLALGALERALGRGPPVAEVTRVIARELELAEPPVGFHIVQALEPSMGSPVQSTMESAVESSSTWPSAAPTLAPDAAPCDACLAEVLAPPSDDPRARRAAYPFTSCAACGPRLGVMLSLPWARARTTLAGFSLCGECRAEHERDDDRRFHAETLACPRCGPTLAFRVAEPPPSHASSPATSPDATVRATSSGFGAPLAWGERALELAVAHLVRPGAVLAMLGVGGFLLVARARDHAAVRAVRRLKRRDEKPLALLVDGLPAARLLAALDDREEAALSSPAAPIVLARAHAHAHSGLSPLVAPESPLVGLMLPSTPLHALVARALGEPLVCTSGNRTDEPLATRLGELAEALGLGGAHEPGGEKGSLAELAVGLELGEQGGLAVLDHDRPVARPLDDSVVRLTPAGPLVLRRARGLAPRPVARLREGPVTLALGAHQKVTVSLSVGALAVMSPHLGDLGGPRAREGLERAARDLMRLHGAWPSRVACDAHPDYASTRLAEALARELGAELVRVQHHHAHVASVAAERGLTGPVLGLAWDGFGLGSDGTLWGGEALVVDGARCERVGHVRTFALPGGERAAREPRRAALGLLCEVAPELALGPGGLLERAFTEAERGPLAALLGGAARGGLGGAARGGLVARTSSVGRLFDAAACLLGLRTHASFEGQAALEVELAASSVGAAAPWPMPLSRGPTGLVAELEPVARGLAAGVASGARAPELAARLHESLAALAEQLACEVGLARVVLAGGCFQNARLATRVVERLEARGHEVYLPRALPPGDGGLSLGQLVVARAR